MLRCIGELSMKIKSGGGVRPKGYDFVPFWSGIGYGFR